MYNDYSYLMSNTIAGSTSSTTDALVAGGVMGAVISFLMTYAFIVFIIAILTIIANWKIFTKAGEKGWKSIIPIYNMVILFRISGISPWWILLYLLAPVPIIGLVVSFGLMIYLYLNLAKAFGKGAGFTVGLILLNTIFVMILGFGSSEYQLNKKQVVKTVE